MAIFPRAQKVPMGVLTANHEQSQSIKVNISRHPIGADDSFGQSSMMISRAIHFVRVLQDAVAVNQSSGGANKLAVNPSDAQLASTGSFEVNGNL